MVTAIEDLFLANDFGADVFYQNNGDGTFRDVSQTTETADRGSGMNVSVTDINGDGFPDYTSPTSTYYRRTSR